MIFNGYAAIIYHGCPSYSTGISDMQCRSNATTFIEKALHKCRSSLRHGLCSLESDIAHGRSLTLCSSCPRKLGLSCKAHHCHSAARILFCQSCVLASAWLSLRARAGCGSSSTEAGTTLSDHRCGQPEPAKLLRSDAGPIELLNVACDPTRELWQDSKRAVREALRAEDRPKSHHQAIARRIVEPSPCGERRSGSRRRFAGDVARYRFDSPQRPDGRGLGKSTCRKNRCRITRRSCSSCAKAIRRTFTIGQTS